MVKTEFCIVTPVYNQGMFLEKTIRSILDQEGDFRLNYTVINDGSTDNSGKILDWLDSEFKSGNLETKCAKLRFRAVHQKNRGQVLAINRGFSATPGRIMNWINSDDYLLSGALQSVSDFASSHKTADAWAGTCNIVGVSGKTLHVVVPKNLEKDSIVDWSKKGFFFQPSCFFSRKAWDKCGPLDNAFYCSFDVDFFIKLASHFEFGKIDAVLSEALHHPGAKTQAFKDLSEVEKYVIQARHGYESLAVRNILEYMEYKEKSRLKVSARNFLSRVFGRAGK